MTSRQVRWGFLGAGYVASRALAPAVHAAQGATLQAVAARDAERARRLEPATVHRSYRDLLDDAAVDAVYISLTNEAHLPWIVESVRAGKHVLCEKPMTLDAQQCESAFAEASAAGVRLVEATWSRWHPRYRRADELLRQGGHGPVSTLRATFTFDGVPPGNYRLDATRGGGALLDLGPYLLAPVVDWCDDDWSAVVDESEVNQNGADLTTSASLRGEQTEVYLEASIVRPERQTLDVATAGLTVSWGPPAHTSWRTEATLTITEGHRRWEERFAPCDAYQLMVEDVSRAVRGDAVEFLPDAQQSLRTAALIDLVSSAVERAGSSTSARERS